MSAQMIFAAEEFEPPTVSDFWQPLVGGGDSAFALTRPIVVLALTVVLISVVLLRVSRHLSVVPGRAQYLTEGLYGFVRNGIARDVLGSKDFLTFLPMLFTMFTLILVNNLLGVVPFVQFPTFSRIGFPIALTLVVYLTYHGIGIRRHGLAGYVKSWVPPGLPPWIVPFIFVLEAITYLVTRPLTLALRLFANMFAGHLLLLVFILGGEFMLIDGGIGLKLVSIGSFGLGFIMTVFEILVEFLQAYIFTLLAALYIAGALADEH